MGKYSIIFGLPVFAFIFVITVLYIRENKSQEPEAQVESAEEIVADGKYFYITGDLEVDRYIQNLAEGRGYEKREIVDEEDLVEYEVGLIYKDVLQDLKDMRSEMEKLGMNLVFASGYRSPERQRGIFKRKLGNNFSYAQILSGEADSHIDLILSQSSIPGYSKHHSGRAIDFGCDNYVLENSFVNTKCYEWLSDNDFENAKRFNFYPSYPFGVSSQGPEPEPWEFVWEA